LDSRKKKIEQLPQAMLTKAFLGELVEQLPTDGDARELLEQIKKAKAGLDKPGKTRKYSEAEPEHSMAAEAKEKYGKK
jgi:type I restriction enzyme S subunit